MANLIQKSQERRKIEIKPRPVTISSFEITRIEGPEIDFSVHCTKGTYIRSLAYDFGKALNSGAYLSALERTSIGKFNLEDAWDLEELVEHIELGPLVT